MASKRRERINAFLLVIFLFIAANTSFLCYYVTKKDVSEWEGHLHENMRLHYQLRDEPEQKSVHQKPSQPLTNDTGTTSQHHQEQQPRPQHPLLNCTRYGGPYDFNSLDEMVYWKEIPEDATYQSKFHKDGDEERFLTIDTDMGGFNNQRMVFEINIAMAIVTGRTLVMPRDRVVSHIHTEDKFAMNDFFDLQKIASSYPGALKLMSTDDYIAQEGRPEKLDIPRDFYGFSLKADKIINDIKENRTNLTSNYYSHHDIFMVNNAKELQCNVSKHGKEYCSNYTDWIDLRHRAKPLRFHQYYLDEFFFDHPKVVCPKWGAKTCVATIPAFNNNDNNHINNATGNKRNNNINNNPDRFKAWTKDLKSEDYWKRHDKYVRNPPLVNDPPEKRLPELIQKRTRLCVYDQKMQQSKYYHMRDTGDPESRLIGHWYDYIFFEDWKEDLWMKRFMRDKLKYNDLIQCTAAKIVADIRKTSKTLYNHPDGQFHSMHVRRTDFKKHYKKVERNASDIYNDFLERDVVPKDSVVFVATDEADKHWFDVFRENYQRVYFLDDFVEDYLKDIPKEYYGMIDQLVASRGEHFVGTYYSTFTGYINRLRGYHSQKHYNPNLANSLRKPPREAKGIIPSWFYFPKGMIDRYQQYAPIGVNFFGMEFPHAWRNIDFGVGIGADSLA